MAQLKYAKLTSASLPVSYQPNKPENMNVQGRYPMHSFHHAI